MAVISGALLGMMAVSLIGSLVSAGISASTAYQNMFSQERINAENVQAQKDINAQNVEAQAAINQQNIDYSKEFAQNQVQWKMADLQAAGLNPTLAAGGLGGSSGPSALSTPHQSAAMQQAPMLDMSGVSSAINAMSNMMMTSALLNERQGFHQQSNQNYADRTEALKQKYLNAGVYRKMNAASTMVNSAKQLERGMSSSDLKQWKKIMEDIAKTPGSRDFKNWWEK